MDSAIVMRLALLALLLCQVSTQDERSGSFIFGGNFFFNGLFQPLNGQPEKLPSNENQPEQTSTAAPTTESPFVFNETVYKPVKVADLSHARDSYYWWYDNSSVEDCASRASPISIGSFALVGERCYIFVYWRNDTSLVQPEPKGDGNDTMLYIKDITLDPEDCVLPDGSVIGPNRYTSTAPGQIIIFLANLPGYENTEEIECKGKLFTCDQGKLDTEDVTLEKYPDGKSCAGVSNQCEEIYRTMSAQTPINNDERLADVIKFSEEVRPDAKIDIKGAYLNTLMFLGEWVYKPDEDRMVWSNQFNKNYTDLPFANEKPSENLSINDPVIKAGKFVFQQKPVPLPEPQNICLMPYPLGIRPCVWTQKRPK